MNRVDNGGLASDHWPARPDDPALKQRAIDVWSVDLDRDASSIGALHSLLSADERERASRFHFERDRRRYVCARGALRSVLGEYLHTNAAAIAFTYGAHGKPALAGGAPAVSFNVSHSHELALMAVAPPEFEIGVDVELIRPLPDSDAIARRFFAPAELAKWCDLPPEMREAGFFHCWTRKEAYLKAVGDGLARSLDAFEVTFAPNEHAELRVVGDDRESARWALVALTPRSGYAAALVASRGFDRIECWRWTE